MFCWQCGKEIYPGEFFCANCGAKVIQVQEPVMQEPPAPRPVEVQEPVMQESPAPQPIEMQGPMMQEATGPVIQGAVQQVPVEQKPNPKPLKKGVLVTVIVVAALVFIIGVVGAFYFAKGDDSSNDSMTQGRWEEVEDKDDIVKQGEPSGSEDANYDNPEENPTEGKLPTQEENPTEGKLPTQEENPIEGKLPSREENPTEGEKPAPEEPDKAEAQQDIPNPESSWDDQRIPAFSGRDVYPDIDGYAEGRLGDSMHTYWFDYSVTGAYICAEYGGYLPKAGYEVLVVEMAVRNTFDEKIPMYDVDFQAQWNDVSDNAYAWPLEDAEFLGEDVLPSYYILDKSQVVMGLLLFEVPVGYCDFTIAYWEMFDDDTYGDLFFLDFTVNRNQNGITI